MKPDRPDLTQVAPDVLAYIELLEAELQSLQGSPVIKNRRPPQASLSLEDDLPGDRPADIEPSEPPTSLCVITGTKSGMAKRTHRHHYYRQNRGGMGIFDLETSEDDPPAFMTIADQDQAILALTNLGRAFRLPVRLVPEEPVRGRGASIIQNLNLTENEYIAALAPEQASGYLALASQSGMVRLLRHHVFGEYMKPGTSLYDYRIFGPLASACWTTGNQDLFIATREGRAIRFSEKLVPPQGTLGLRISNPDFVVSITSVNPDSGVFLLGSDGKGTIRLMEGFAPNKSPGAGGKTAMATDHLICALSTDDRTEVFIISHLSKIIRFNLDQIPPKADAVQGVVCISLRADRPVSATLS